MYEDKKYIFFVSNLFIYQDYYFVILKIPFIYTDSHF